MKIELTEEQIKQIKQIKGEEVKRWKPKREELYYTFFTDGKIEDHQWFDDEYDKIKALFNNVFKTKQEAEDHLEYLKALKDVTDYIYDNDMAVDEKDMNDPDICKCYLAYYMGSIFYIRNWHTGKITTIIPPIKTPQQAEQLIKDKEKQLKVIFKVK